MVVHKERIGDILLSAGLINEEELELGLKHQQETDKKLGETLVELGVIEGVELAAALSNQLGIPYVRLEDYDLTRELVSKIPRQIAQTRKIIPIEELEDRIVVAVSDPLDVEAIDEIEMTVDKDVEPVVAVKSRIEEELDEIYGTEEEVSSIVEELKEDDLDVVSPTGAVADQNIDEMVNETPVVKFVNTVLLEAVKHGASDVHLEPFEHNFVVRLRLDGVLHRLNPPPQEFQSAVISRIKVMADLDIAETRLPQDGRIKIELAGREVEFRVSTLPTVFGESVVLRVLNKQDMALDVSSLGMTDQQESTFKEMIERPNGIILNTGPTSSGKTTTLFSGLNYINSTENKILTMEDPIEYELPGVTQSQVNEQAGFTFANGMRSMLRQDPDVCLVGEIRDPETAEIAVQASLTGHLVLSTVHTNQAAGAVTRLTNMGIQPFLLTSTLQAVLAQRLVRVVCDNCKEVHEPDPNDIRKLGKNPVEYADRPFLRGAGCSECGGTGYEGRTAIFELLEMSEGIEDLCSRQASATEIHNWAVEEGMKTLTEHGWDKVLEGITTVEEVVRVAPAEDKIALDLGEIEVDEELAGYL